MIFSLVAMTGLEKCCITSAYLQWLCHSGERPVARGPLVFVLIFATNIRVTPIMKIRNFPVLSKMRVFTQIEAWKLMYNVDNH